MHSVTSEGKECNDCRRNEAVLKMEKDEKQFQKLIESGSQ
jgi:hypothetical protein